MNMRSLAKSYAAIDWESPRLKAFDYGLSIVTVGYGAYVGSPLVIAIGMLGCLATKYGVNARIIRFVQGAVQRRIAR